MQFRFTLSHEVLGSQVISEPDGFKESKIVLERDPEFFSIIERFEGSAGGALIFYGRNDTEGINGGIEFIREVERTYGFDATIGILIELSYDGVTYSTIFEGQLDLSMKNEMPDNKMQVPVIRGDLWAKFINRYGTPVNVQSTTTLDGNPCTPVEPIRIHMTPQVLRRTFDASSSGPGITSEDVNVIVSGTYYQVSFDQKERTELEDVFVLPQIDNTEEPAPLIELAYAGEYDFSIQTLAYDYAPGSGGYNFAPGEGLGDYIQFYLNINGTEHAFTLGDYFDSDNTDGGQIYTLTLNNQILPKGSHIKIYGKAISSLTVGGGTYLGEIRWNGPLTGNISLSGGATTAMTLECTCTILGRTVRPAFEAEGFLIHDLIYGVIQRITQ